MNGAEILIDGFQREGVEVLFGYPGGSVIPIFDVFYNREDIRFLLTRHEQGAVHAADGYARSTGKVGVCIVTSGPGATNTITGIATAKLDSTPIVIISGQVPTYNIGTDAFQETDMVGLTRSICKHNYLVKDIADLPGIIKEAFHIARTGRPGPVSIDIPIDIAKSRLKQYQYPETVELPGYKPVLKGNSKQIAKIAQAIRKAKRPLLYTGGGIVSANAAPQLRTFVERTRIPVVTTLMGLGTVPFDHPCCLGMPGMHGRVAANYALMDCDLLIAIGVRFDDRITGPRDTFAPKATIAHVDIDPAEIGKNVPTQIPVVGDARKVLEELIAEVDYQATPAWLAKTNGWREKYQLEYKSSSDREIAPQKVIETLNELIDPNAILVTDVGQHQMWAALYYHYRNPRAFLSSGGLGTMGFGLPAAMGAALGNPDRPVVCVCGDGGFQMNIQELATCAINRIPVKVIVLNNSYLGMVRQWQDLFWKRKYSQVCLKRSPDCPPDCRGPRKDCPVLYTPDFVRVAEANRVRGLRASKTGEVPSVLKEGLAQEGPVVMEFLVKRTQNVYPMVPAGKPINQIIMGEAA